MNDIKKVPVDQAEKFVLSNKLWGTDAYEHEVYAQLTYDEEGFIVKFTVAESDPLRDKKQHLTDICLDSCVEFFVNFTPEKSAKYMNLEVNAGGFMDAAFRSDRYETEPLTLEEIASFNITPEIYEDHWAVSYKIGFDVIKKYYPEFDIDTCEYVTGNLYKCGDLTEMEHYVTYFKVDTPEPDYHRPEYFGRFDIVK